MEFKRGRGLLLGRGHRRTFRLEEEEGVGADTRAPAVSGIRKKRHRFGLLLGRGWLLIWAGIYPRGPFLLFFVLILFHFLFSYFFHNFCMFGSNCFKPNL
jgi:hypothetical protein